MRSIELRDDDIARRVDRILGENIAMQIQYVKDGHTMPVLNCRNEVKGDLYPMGIGEIVHALYFGLTGEDLNDPQSDTPTAYEKLTSLARKFCLDGRIQLPEHAIHNGFNMVAKAYITSMDPLAEMERILQEGLVYMGVEIPSTEPQVEYLRRNFHRFHNSGALENNGLSSVQNTWCNLESPRMAQLDQDRRDKILTYTAVCRLNEELDPAFAEAVIKSISNKHVREQLHSAVQMRKDGKL